MEEADRNRLLAYWRAEDTFLSFATRAGKSERQIREWLNPDSKVKPQQRGYRKVLASLERWNQVERASEKDTARITSDTQHEPTVNDSVSKTSISRVIPTTVEPEHGAPGWEHDVGHLPDDELLVVGAYRNAGTFDEFLTMAKVAWRSRHGKEKPEPKARRGLQHRRHRR